MCQVLESSALNKTCQCRSISSRLIDFLNKWKQAGYRGVGAGRSQFASLDTDSPICRGLEFCLIRRRGRWSFLVFGDASEIRATVPDKRQTANSDVSAIDARRKKELPNANKTCPNTVSAQLRFPRDSQKVMASLARTSLLRHTASSSSPCSSSALVQQTRSKSTRAQSPYGTSHRQRLPALPRPTVALFPQLVVMTDGSTYTHYTTSPRSVIRLTRDVNNNPLYRPGSEGEDQLEDETGRMGRFKRRFEGTEGEVVDFASFDEGTPEAAKSDKGAKCMCIC